MAAETLTIETYDRAEAEAISRASYPAIRAFRTAAFSMVNFPTRIREEQELVRYADIMYELADRELLYRRSLYSIEEEKAICWLSDSIEILTRKISGRPIRPFMCLFPPIPIWRAIETLCAGRKISVLEIGPGSGHLGAYLIRAGHRYSATDNTQALYLWQNRLFGHLASIDFADLVLVDHDCDARVTLFPWWRFADMFRAPRSVDVVVCEAALGEMDVFAVNYTIRLAARMLRGSSIGSFLFTKIGEQRVNSLAYVLQRLERAGFTRQVLGPVNCCSLNPPLLPKSLPPIGGGALRPACEFLQIDRDNLLPSYDFIDFLGLRE